MSEPRKRDLKNLLTEEEVILFFMKENGCDREKAEALFEQFRIDHPGIEAGEA